MLLNHCLSISLILPILAVLPTFLRSVLEGIAWRYLNSISALLLVGCDVRLRLGERVVSSSLVDLNYVYHRNNSAHLFVSDY